MTKTANLMPPTLSDFETLARGAWEGLPEAYRAMCGHVELFVADFADAEMLEAVGLEDPFELSGLYMGVDLTQQSSLDPTPEASRVFLFRRPILDEWAERETVTLGELVSHVLVHEIGHHFGLSDEDMHKIEASEG
ncbi:metallopeptidase family protein [Maricaulis sp.]|uniref:metallopeptidase family protein n=1 Tax=Maricaulis sp. TaxID=1486257 RepID=UPI003A94AFA6